MIKRIERRMMLLLLISAIGFMYSPTAIFAENHSNEKPNSKTVNPLFVDPASRNFSENPDLLKRIFSGPHGYFRFINIPFSEEVCRRFSEIITTAPTLNLHGDAHIEQYAVTDLGRGLTDYDDSSTGPGIIDLLRFGISLHLTCRENGWTDSSTALLDRFFAGYRDALKNPKMSVDAGTWVKRVRTKFKNDRVSYFKWIDTMMSPMPDDRKSALIAAIQPYVSTKMAEDSTLSPDYFRIVQVGDLQMGIGSALDEKYLVRIRGKSADPLDDVMLEFKEVRDLSGIDCINSGQELDPFRILLGQTRIAYQPFEHLGYFRFHEKNFWVHSWVDNYKEVKIGKSFQSPKELAEVVYDVGVQLGKGHVKQIASPLDLQLRREQLQFLKKNETALKTACRELTEETIAAWQMFCDRVRKDEG